MKLKNISANCQATTINGQETLFSYGVAVARYGKNGFELGEKWDYSRTTAKHVSQWAGIPAKEIRQKIKSGKYQIVNL